LNAGKEDPYITAVASASWSLGMITSKITSKAQTTIPHPVRAALQIHKGDELVYRIDGDRVILTKAKREPTEDPFATFSEWSSEADQRAYGEL
jgi:antitoxin PrlF